MTPTTAGLEQRVAELERENERLLSREKKIDEKEAIARIRRIQRKEPDPLTHEEFADICYSMRAKHHLWWAEVLEEERADRLKVEEERDRLREAMVAIASQPGFYKQTSHEAWKLIDIAREALRKGTTTTGGDAP